MVRVENTTRAPLELHVKMASPAKGRRKSRFERIVLLDKRTTDIDDKVWAEAKKTKPVQTRLQTGDLVEISTPVPAAA